MKNMSFSLTPQQLLNGSKTVTRRVGWEDLQPGDQVQACEKCMGLKKGEKIKVLGIIEVLTVHREPLRHMIDSPDYGGRECVREGFPDLTPEAFVTMFCKANSGCTPNKIITRISFKLLPQTAGEPHGH